MQSSSIKFISFSVNNWAHLYSLEQAVEKATNISGGKLVISGNIRKTEFLNNQDLAIEITFNRLTRAATYSRHENHIILGEINRDHNKITSSLSVDEDVFHELRNNAIEYGNIDGIHIMVTLGLLSENETWAENTTLKLISLNYAMKGDA